ncbi:MAG: Nramp family divalent metal transporter [Planctomycetaceae bacterium]|nr:Nramp family divalent metal transporter [Planctomycetaceae bacterium]
MSDAPRLPRSAVDWIRIFGPGAIIASLTIGTGELIFSTRGGAIFGYDILYVFAVISLLKWGLVVSTSRHMVLTGVHPYERMIDLPGPRGWMPIMLLLMATVSLPIWISFHAGVLGNLTSWITGTRTAMHGGADYLWGAGILAMVLLLSATGGYSVLERVQLFVVTAMVLSSVISLIIYNPDWMDLFLGMVPRPLAYPEWLSEKYPEIARHSVWVETTRYVGVIGGAGFDYLAYTSWLREKSWGVLPGKATPELIAEIAADPQHEARKWISAPFVDCAISFLLIIAFSAVFVASGTIVLRAEEIVPDESNLLNLQSRFVTQIHSILLPLYVAGAFLAMLGTLYGTIEVGCSIADEMARSFRSSWSEDKSHRLKQLVLGWCGTFAMAILIWLLIRQMSPATPIPDSTTAPVAVSEDVPPEEVDSTVEPARVDKPKLLLAILTPVNLFTGVLSCGLICLAVVWMDRRWLPAELQPPTWLTLLNILSSILFLYLGLKGYWENENRNLILWSMCGILALSMVIAKLSSSASKEQAKSSS